MSSPVEPDGELSQVVSDADLSLIEGIDDLVPVDGSVPGAIPPGTPPATAQKYASNGNGGLGLSISHTFEKEGELASGLPVLRLELVMKGTPEFWSASEIKSRQTKGGVWAEMKSDNAAPPPTSFQQMFLGPAESTWLDITIIFCIVLNTAILAVQHPGNGYSKGFNDAMDMADFVLTSIFTLEMFVKIFAFGFYKGHTGSKIPGSYISDSWNRLDFVVVIVSWLSVLVEALDLELPIKVSTLRALRILRVLKSLKFLKGIGVILVTLGNSAASMTTILMFLTFVFTIAGIVGIQMFRGTLNWRCSKIAPQPDGSGLDWLSLGIGDITYRKHCMPNWDEPKCPEFPPCNIIYDKFSHEPIMDTVDNMMSGQTVALESFNGARKDMWLQRGSNPACNTTSGVCSTSPVYSDADITNYTTAAGGTVQILGGGTVYRSSYLDFESYKVWTAENVSLAANESAKLRCPPCYTSRACPSDEACYEYGNPGFGHHGFDNIVMSWLTIFIEMANLYWWETGFRTQDADTGEDLGSLIAYSFGFVIVVVLSMITVNMFVAVITNEFGNARAEEGMGAFEKKQAIVKLKVTALRPAGGKKMTPWADQDDPEVEIEAQGHMNIAQIKAIFQHRYVKSKVQDKHMAMFSLMEEELMSPAQRVPSPDSSDTASVSRKEMNNDERMCTYLQKLADNSTTASDEDEDESAKIYVHTFKDGTLMEWCDTVVDTERYENGENDDGETMYYTPEASPLPPAGVHRIIPAGRTGGRPQELGLRQLVLHKPPPCYHSKWCANLITKGYFDNFIMAFILMNTCTLASEHFNQPETFTIILDNVGHLFNVVFTCELIFKVFGMGFSNYITIPFNKLDCFIVITSGLNYMGDVLPGASVARLLRVFRLFRVARVIRLLYKYESMKKLLGTVMGSGVALANLTLFILFAVSIFAVFGMHLFADTYPDHLPVPRRNFEHIGRAWLMAFQTLTGDDWCNQMYQYMNVAGPVLPCFVYGMCFISCNYILTNLFIAVILENFEMAEEVKKIKQEIEEMKAQRKQFTKQIERKEAEQGCLANDSEVSQFLQKTANGRGKATNPAVPDMDPDEEDSFDLKNPMINLKTKKPKVNECANCCRNPLLWCCRGCRKADCKKKTRNEQKFADENPEDRSNFCCHGRHSLCGIAEENNSALFIFHGKTATYRTVDTDMFGDRVEHYRWYYTHPVRRVAQAIERNPWFERMVMGAILISSILLAYEGPADSLEGLIFYDDVLIPDALAFLDTIFYGVFMFEFFTKIFHRGFLFTPEAYLADGWNRLDCVVVAFSTMNYVPGQGKSSLGRVFRLGRCLRPLRMVNKNPGLKVIVTAVMESLGTNLGVMGLAGMLFLIFGILGCNLFGGKFWYCTCPDVVGEGVWKQICNDCLVKHNLTQYTYGEDFQKDGPAFNTVCMEPCDDQWTRYFDAASIPDEVMIGENDRYLCTNATYVDDVTTDRLPCEWLNKRYNFDSIGAAFSNMFTASTLAGWTDIMEASTDIVGIDQHPSEYANAPAAVYWVLFVFLNAFFITNLFVGVLVDYIAQSDGSALQTEEQQKWTDLKRFIAELQPDIDPPVPPKDPIRRHSLKLVTSSKWETTSSTCIVLNVIVMCMEFQYQPIWYEDAMEYINNGFLVFFTVEMVLKLIGMGGSRYWLDSWNRFDAIVVTASWGGMILNISVQVVRAFRAFRIVLVLKNAKKLQALFKCLIWAIVPSFNIGALMILHYSLFAILGMQVIGAGTGPHFDEVKNVFPAGNGASVTGHQAYLLSELGQTQQTVQTNFKSFFGAMKLLFECSTGKDWKIVMYEVGDVAGDTFAFGYFFCHYFFSVYILCNLFVAVIIDTFNSSLRELPVQPENMLVFRNVWKAHCIRQREELKAKGWQNSKMARAMDTFILIGEVEEHEEDEEERAEREKIALMQGRGRGGMLQSTKSGGAVMQDPSIEPERKWSNVVRLLKDVGRFKGPSEDVLRQKKLKKEVHLLEESIYTADIDSARKILDGLERHQDLLTRSLHRTVELWDVLVRPTDRQQGVEGLGGELTASDLEQWDSGTLCAHPTWGDDQLRKNESLWDDWWAKFSTELKLRKKEEHNLYVEKERGLWAKLCKPNQDSNEDDMMAEGCVRPTLENMISYNAVRTYCSNTFVPVVPCRSSCLV